MTVITFLKPGLTLDYFGLLPLFFNESDPRPAKEQADFHYKHGGGWDPFPGFKFNPVTHEISYPGDPAFKPLLRMDMRDEVIFVYDHDWVLILQKDGAYEISRMD